MDDIVKVILGAVIAVIGYLSTALYLAKKKTREAENDSANKEIESIELRAEKELRDKPLSDVISDDNKELRDRRNKPE